MTSAAAERASGAPSASSTARHGRESFRFGSLRLLALVAAIGLLAAACTTGDGQIAGPDPSTSEVQETTVPTTATATEPDVDDGAAEVEELMATLTTDEKIGQLLMPVLAGSGAAAVTSDERASNLEAFGFETPAEIVEAYHLGGVIYLDNVESAEQLSGFSDDLQKVSEADTGIGLLIAIDQEGGRVNRVGDEVTIFPAAAELSGNTTRIVENSYVTGQQVRQQGVNVVLAPVADVLAPTEDGFIGDRSFGSDPEIVAEMVRGSVTGLQQSGVAAAVKHWPGHGATPIDSHRDLPILDISRQQWESRELIPFQAAIEEDVAIVLVGHLALPQLDASGQPATVSAELVDGLLRENLGFDGVVMSDALNMGAVEGIERGEVVVSALLAGIDILLMPPDVEVAYESLAAAVQSGRVSPERLDEAVSRVLRLKQDLGLLPDISERS